MSEDKKTNNMALWEAVEKTDPKYTKQFDNGNFKGTSTTALYTIKKATAQWGVMGGYWGAVELEHMVIEGIWFSKVQVWHPYGKVEQWGATKFKYDTKGSEKSPSRTVIDEEAAKKAYTDALTKCLSYLGFCADIHMGLFDDNKYVAKLKEEFAPLPEIKEPTKEQSEMFDNYKARIKECKTNDDLSTYWKAAYNTMKASLPDSYFTELVAKKDEMKQFLTKGE
jgi:hypothetical protein